jgi:hypothetical protein
LLARHGVQGTPEEFQAVTSVLHGHPLALVLLAGRLRNGSVQDGTALLNSISQGRPIDIGTILPGLVHRIDASLSAVERAALARISLFPGGVRFEDFNTLVVRSDEPSVSGPLAGLAKERIVDVLQQLRSHGLVELGDDGTFRAQPVIRDYFLRAIPDRGPLHQRMAEGLIRVAEARDGSSITKDAAEIILEIVYHLTESKHAGKDQIRRLADLLPKRDDRTLQAYGSVLDAALRIAADAPGHNASAPARPSAFISYLREDADQVTRLRRALEENGIDVWQDTNSLVPGRRWKDEIRKAITGGDFFLACFSETLGKRARTYMREEIRVAIEELQMRPHDRSWFISILLTPAEIPDFSIGRGETLRDLHWVDLHADWDKGISSLLRAFR